MRVLLVILLAWAVFARPAEAASSRRCRALFCHFVGEKVSAEQKSALFYAPSPNVIKAPEIKDRAETTLEALGNHFRELTPEALHADGTRHEPPGLSDTEAESALRAHPMTIVLVPGIFGEFIDDRAFEELFRNGGTYDAASQLHHTFARDSHGNPLFDVVLFDTPRMSFDSLGSIGPLGRRFATRLEDYVRRYRPENLVLVGYSRGTPIALEMLAKAHAVPAKPAWLGKVRGMVSLGGVTLGSELADDAEKDGSLAQRQLKLVADLQKSLRPDRKSFFHNTGAWLRFLSALAPTTDPSSLFRLLAQVKKTDPAASRRLFAEYWKLFGLRHPFRDYGKNVALFDRFLAATLDGVRDLTTRARLEWWRRNIVPTAGMRYYAIGATMPGAGSPLLENPYLGFDAGSLDDALLKESYAHFVSLTGLRLNDSQVSLHKVAFWPDLHRQLNPAQPPIAADFLGVAGTHHWGLTLPTVTPGSHNPYPRDALLKAIAASVAEDLE